VGYVRCKENTSSLIYDATLWEDDAVLLRQASPTPVELYIIPLEAFAEDFSPLGD
jgi:hypothetical protein